MPKHSAKPTGFRSSANSPISPERVEEMFREQLPKWVTDAQVAEIMTLARNRDVKGIAQAMANLGLNIEIIDRTGDDPEGWIPVRAKGRLN